MLNQKDFFFSQLSSFIFITALHFDFLFPTGLKVTFPTPFGSSFYNVTGISSTKTTDMFSACCARSKASILFIHSPNAVDITFSVLEHSGISHIVTNMPTRIDSFAALLFNELQGFLYLLNSKDDTIGPWVVKPGSVRTDDDIFLGGQSQAASKLGKFLFGDYPVERRFALLVHRTAAELPSKHSAIEFLGSRHVEDRQFEPANAANLGHCSDMRRKCGINKIGSSIYRYVALKGSSFVY